MRTKYFATITGSLLIVTLLSVALFATGPRLRGINYDVDSIVKEPGSRLILHFNQPIASIQKADVSIEPEVDFSVTTNQTLAVIELARPLLYDTDYSIKAQVSLSDGNKVTNVSAKFRTRSAETYHISRISNDKIVYQRGFENPETHYTRPQIDEFAIIPSGLAVTLPNDISHGLYIEDLPVIDPGSRQIEMLNASRDGSLLGYLSGSVERGEEYLTRSMKLFDLETNIEFEPNKNLPGTTDIAEWLFTPDSEFVVVMSSSGDVVLLPINEGDQVPLGSASSLDGISFDGRTLYVQDQSGVKSMNIETLERTLITSPSIYAGFSPQVIRVSPSLNGTALYVYSTIQKNGTYENKITYRNGSEDKELYSSVLTEESIINFYPSANDQYLFVETSDSKSARYSGYKGQDRPENIKTKVIEVNTGRVIANFDGFNVRER